MSPSSRAKHLQKIEEANEERKSYSNEMMEGNNAGMPQDYQKENSMTIIETSKLDQLFAKFRSFKDRIEHESELLIQDVQKYILQAEFE